MDCSDKLCICSVSFNELVRSKSRKHDKIGTKALYRVILNDGERPGLPLSKVWADWEIARRSQIRMQNSITPRRDRNKKYGVSMRNPWWIIGAIVYFFFTDLNRNW